MAAQKCSGARHQELAVAEASKASVRLAYGACTIALSCGEVALCDRN